MKYHMVQAVRVLEWHGFKGWLPVIGPMHTDAEHVDFPWPHFHVDWRYAPTAVWRAILALRGNPHAWPIQCPDRFGGTVIAEGPSIRRMTLKRDPGPFPRALPKWMPALERSMACAKLVNGMCPHRGIPVSAMHRDGDVLTCPGHGLQWHAITGDLISSARQIGTQHGD